MLEQQLNHDALASSVQRALFEENPDGWIAFVTHIQKKVTWFGTGLSEMKTDVTPKADQATPGKADPVEKSMEAATTEWGASDEKRGWPWPYLLNRGRLQRQISFFSVIDRSTVRRKAAFQTRRKPPE
jgi:hypothetical protein